MQSHEKIRAYVELVCQQVRWKKVRPRIAGEVTNRIREQKEILTAQGIDENAATDQALHNTGDAVALGLQLDRVNRPKLQWEMFLAVAALLMLGFMIRLFVFHNDGSLELLSTRVLYTGIGIAVMLAAYFTDFTRLGKYPKVIYTLTAAMITLPYLLPHISENGIRLILLLFPLLFAAFLFTVKGMGYIGIMLCYAVFVFMLFITFIVSYLKEGPCFFIAGAVLMGVAIGRNWFAVKRLYGFLLFYILSFLYVAVFFVLNIYRNTYLWQQLQIGFNPQLDAKGAGYMGVLIREMISTAKFFGAAKIRREDLLFTEWFQADYMLTATISLMGWAVFAVILAVLLGFIVKAFQLCIKQKNSLGFIISLSLLLIFVLQAVNYILYNIGLTYPVFPAAVSLPLLSPGSGAFVVNMALIGFMLSVFRTGAALAGSDDNSMALV